MLNFNTIGEITIKLKLRSNVRHFPGAILVYSSRSQAALNLKKWVECAKVRTSGPRKLIAQNPYFHNGNKTFPWLSEDHSKTFGVVLMSCKKKVNFHVVRSALQYSVCRVLPTCYLC